jgi:hypothetical protein
LKYTSHEWTLTFIIKIIWKVELNVKISEKMILVKNQKSYLYIKATREKIRVLEIIYKWRGGIRIWN